MIDMNNLENLATEIGKDIKDIKTHYATKEELHEASETPVFRFAKGDILGGGVGATATITTEDLMNPDSVKVGDIIEDYWSGAIGANRGIWKVTAVNGTNVSVQGIGARLLPAPYNDTELKQRISTLESRPSSGSGGLGTEEIATYSNTIIYVPNGNIVYDKNLKKLHIPKCNVQVGKTSYWCEAQEVSLNGGAGFIVLYKAQKRIAAGSVGSTNEVLATKADVILSLIHI